MSEVHIEQLANFRRDMEWYRSAARRVLSRMVEAEGMEATALFFGVEDTDLKGGTPDIHTALMVLAKDCEK